MDLGAILELVDKIHDLDAKQVVLGFAAYWSVKKAIAEKLAEMASKAKDGELEKHKGEKEAYEKLCELLTSAIEDAGASNAKEIVVERTKDDERLQEMVEKTLVSLLAKK